MANSQTLETTRRSCDVGAQRPANNRVAKWAAAGGLLASLGICVACCLLPFTLIAAAVTGAWIGAIDALAPYKWAFIALTTALLGYGLYAAYGKPKRACTAGADCQTCGSRRSVRIWLWVATVLALGGIIFERIEPLLGK